MVLLIGICLSVGHARWLGLPMSPIDVSARSLTNDSVMVTQRDPLGRAHAIALSDKPDQLSLSATISPIVQRSPVGHEVATHNVRPGTRIAQMVQANRESSLAVTPPAEPAQASADHESVQPVTRLDQFTPHYLELGSGAAVGLRLPAAESGRPTSITMPEGQARDVVVGGPVWINDQLYLPGSRTQVANGSRLHAQVPVHLLFLPSVPVRLVGPG